MCRNRPGPRCSDHSHQSLERASDKVTKNLELQDILSQKFAAAEPGTKTAERLSRNLEKAAVENDDLQQKLESAQIEYDATPKGQQELKEQKSIDNLTDEEREILEERLFIAQARREWQRRVAANIRRIEKEQGVAAAVLWAQHEAATSQQKLQEIQQELREKRDDVVRKNPGKANLLPQKPRIHDLKTFKVLRFLARQELLFDLIHGDLDDYVLRKLRHHTDPKNFVRKVARV